MKTLIPTFCATAVMFIACGHGYGSRKTGRDNDDWPELAATWLKRTFKMPVK